MADENQTLEPALPGDVLPNIVLPDATDSGVGMAQQSRAGHWLVLAFVEPSDLASHAEALAATRKKLDDSEGMLFTVAFSAPDPSLVGVDLFDQSKRGAQFLLGKPEPGIAIISPEGRLAAQFAIGELEKAAAFCQSAFEADRPDVMSSLAPVLVLPNVFDPALCERITAFWADAPKTKDEVASAQQGNEASYASLKRRTDATITDGDLFNDIRNRFTRRVLPMIDRVFRMRVASMEAPRVGCYSSSDQGGFGRHRDNTTAFTAHRRFAMTLNLNTGAYEGGELRFPEFGRKLYQPDVGGAVIFSCSLLHEALPVTKGDRFGLFTFFTDAEGLEQEKKMAREMAAQQQAAQPH